MPTYEYICTECTTRIEILATFSEKEKGLNVSCPKCGSKKVAQVFGSFQMISPSKRKSNPPICGPQAGPDCCT